MIRIFAILLTLIGSATAQTGTPIKQSGFVTPGHAAVWVTNGVVQDGGNGVGTVTGPASTTSGDLACWNNVTGTSLSDCGTFGAWQPTTTTFNIGSGALVPNLEICNSSLPCSVPLYISNYGMVSVGNFIQTWPNLNGNMSDTTGPGLRVAGDVIFADHRSPGDLPHTVSGCANNGSGLFRLTAATASVLTTGEVIQVGGIGGCSAATGVWTVTTIDSTHFDLQGSSFSGSFTSNGWFADGSNSLAIGWDEPGAVPVNRRFYSAQNLNVDGTGGAFIVLHPDSTITANSAPGEIGIFAYGSSNPASAAYFNTIRLGTRSGVNTVADVLDIGPSLITALQNINIGSGGTSKPLNIHFGTNLNIAHWNNGGVPQLLSISDDFTTYETLALDGNPLYLNHFSGNSIILGGTTTGPDSATWSSGGISGTTINNSAIGSGTPAVGSFTTLAASSTVSGTGFSTYLASPPAIGGTSAAAITGTTVRANSGFSANGTSGVSTVCTVTAGNSLTFTFGLLTTKGANCT